MTTPANGPGPFAELLQQHRQAAGLSQEELAERAGLSARGISDLERGVRRSPYLVTVRALATALDLDATAQARLLAAARPRSSVPEARRSTGSLPVAVNSFVGREREVTEIGRLLSTTRLLTLVGPGGVGKTRLALEAGRSASALDGVWFVELAPLAEAALVPRAIAAALGVKENPTRSIGQSLADALGANRALLVLDNFEHVIDAAADVASLLRACAGLTILATSREPLRLQAERVYDVPPLALPVGGELHSLDQVCRVPALELFVERARALNGSFQLSAANAGAVAELCRRLDGLPLAIELAAARTRGLEPEVMLERLDRSLDLLHGLRDQPARHASLRAVLDWSYHLLSSDEQVLLGRLAVFAGGWTLTAAEAVCAEGPLARQHVLDALDGLVAKSLVVSGDGRYRMLETVRQYALDRLHQSGEAEAMRERHAAWVTELVERTPPEAYDPETLALLDREQDNLRAALRWAIDAGDADGALRLSSNWLFWSVRGHYSEGHAWLAQALGVPGAQTSILRGRGLCVLGYLAYVRGDLTAAERLLEESHRFAVERSNYVLQAASLHHLAHIAGVRGDLRHAFTLLSEARALSQRARKPREGGAWEAMHLVLMSGIALMLGDEAEARRLAEACLSLSRQLGHSMTTAGALRVLGKLAARSGQVGTARALLGESLALHRQLGNQQGVSRALASLGDLALNESNSSSAGHCYAEALRVCEGTGERFDIAACLARIAGLTAEHDPRLAVWLASSALGVWDAFGAKPYPDLGAELDRTLGDLRTRLAAPVFDEAWQAGRVMSLEEAVELALAAAEAAARRDGQAVAGSGTVVPLKARNRVAAHLARPQPQQQAGR